MSRSSRPAAVRALWASTKGATAVEFAIIIPLLVSLAVGAFELTRWMRARQHMQDYAITVVNDISATPSDVKTATLKEMILRIGILAPELVDPSRDAWSDTSTDYLSVTISLVMMTADVSGCQANCTYTPRLIWTFGNNKRVCQISGGSYPLASLPDGAVNQAGPVVIVDVKSLMQFDWVNAAGVNLAPVSFRPTLSRTVWQPVKNWRGPSGRYPKLDSSTPSTPWSGSCCVTLSGTMCG